jgi:cytochrome c oxidase cbb3-type subunit 3
MGGVRFGRAAMTVAALSCLMAATPARAQHETALDVEDGSRAFRTSCQSCHGPDGDLIPGVDLGRGQFKRAVTDEDLVRVIRGGVPGTAMPPVSMSVEQATRIVAYLRSAAASRRSASAAGDPVRGRALFDGKGRCGTCHRVDGRGGGLGPDLTRIGQLRRSSELEQSLVDPDAEVLPNNRSVRVVTREGTALTGLLLNHDTFTVQLLDSTGTLRSFTKAELKSQSFVPSPMPPATGTLSPAEVTDVVSYLVSLKGRSAP